MKTQTLLALALLSATPAAALAQTTPAPTAPVALPAATPAAQAVTLRYKFAPGQIHRYKLNMDMDGQMFMGQAGTAMPLKTSMHMVMKQTVKDVRASDGAATLAYQIEDSHVFTNGKEITMPAAQQAQMKKPYTIVMLPTGKMLSMDMPALAGSAMPGMDLTKGMFNSTAFMPEAPVKVGDTWKGTAASPAVGTDMTFTSTLTSVDQKNGATLATIGQTQSGLLNMTMSKGMPMTMKMVGKITGSGTQIFDADAGAIASTTGTSDTDMTMTFEKPATGDLPPGVPQGMKMQMKTTVTMQLLADAAPAATTPAPAAP